MPAEKSPTCADCQKKGHLSAEPRNLYCNCAMQSAVLQMLITLNGAHTHTHTHTHSYIAYYTYTYYKTHICTYKLCTHYYTHHHTFTYTAMMIIACFCKQLSSEPSKGKTGQFEPSKGKTGQFESRTSHHIHVLLRPYHMHGTYCTCYMHVLSMCMRVTF